MRPESAWYAGLQYRPPHHTEAVNMQIKRLLDDREVFIGDKVLDAQGRSYAFLEHPHEQYLRTSSATTPHESPLK